MNAKNIFIMQFFQAIADEGGNTPKSISLNFDNINTPISITDHLIDVFSYAINKAFPTSSNLPPAVITPVSNAKFGDYQCNSSMALVKLLAVPGAKPPSPRDVATKILENVPKSPLIAKCDIAGPGFINVFLERSYAKQALTSILTNGVQPPEVNRQRVVVDFSSPNIGKLTKEQNKKVKN